MSILGEIPTLADERALQNAGYMFISSHFIYIRDGRIKITKEGCQRVHDSTRSFEHQIPRGVSIMEYRVVCD